MRVFLVHGMGRTPASMVWLALRLRLAGHRPTLFGYAVTLERLASISERFTERVRATLGHGSAGPDDGAGNEVEPWAVVGHSLGNIITRLASPELPPGFSRFVMLAPPNRPPAIARELQDQPFFQALTRDAGQRICDEEFYEALPMPEVPSLIIAGTRGVASPWHPLANRDNDAIVAVDEARIPGVPLATVPGIHSFLMNRSDVFSLVHNFLLSGEPPEGSDIVPT